MKRLLAVLVWILPLAAADKWTEYRSGPFHVYSDAGDKDARPVLNELEQLRGALQRWIGKDLGRTELESVWPIDLVLFDKASQYGPYALPQATIDGGSAILAAWNAETALPLDLKRDIVRRLIEDNAARMPDTIETGLADVLSTIQVSGTRVSVGAPLPVGMLEGSRLKAWIKVQYLATNPEYAGRFRVYLNNLQQGGDEDLASRNTLNLAPEELAKKVDAYAQAGVFEAVPVSGKAINPNRDFYEKDVADSVMQGLFAELKAQGKNPPPESPRGYLAKNTREALQLAIAVNPKWSEPWVKLAALETNPVGKVNALKKAAELAPRSSALWQALAEAQGAADQQVDAAKSWAMAVKEAPNEQERARLRQIQKDAEARKAEAEIAARKKEADDRAAEIERLRQESIAEIHAAEDKANREQGGLKSDVKPVQWWSDDQGTPVSGSLTKVDCLKAGLRLTVVPDGGGKAAVYSIPDPNKLAVRGEKEATFACGVQRPARAIKLQHDASGVVKVVEFP